MSDQGDIVEITYVPDEEEMTNEEPIVEEEQKDTGHAHGHSHRSGKKSGSKKANKRIQELEEDVENLQKERDDLKDKYLRTLAEVDNFRKRMKKEKEEFQKYVLGDFILGLLEVFDNFERALKSQESQSANDAQSIISGVEMIYKQLVDMLKKNNVQEIDALGKHFDPNIHQALSKDERDDISDPVILEVYQKGFTYHGKLLRPTLARVAVPKEPEPEPETPQPAVENDDDDDIINE